jgi:hypothetical protein
VLLSSPPYTTHEVCEECVWGMVKKPSWKTMTIYDIPPIVNQSLTQKNIKPGFLATGVLLLNTYVFTDEDFSPSSMTDRPLQDNKNFQNFGL